MRALLTLLASTMITSCSTTAVIPRTSADLRADRDADTLHMIEALGRDGDWLVIRGGHASDDLVVTVTGSPFSHAAVLDASNARVIEAEARGVHFTPLAEFVSKAHRLLLVRPTWSDDASAAAAVAKAREVVGRRYDFLGLVGLDTPDRFYCSGLAVEVYRPRIRTSDRVPRPVEPGQLPSWGRILFDTGPPQIDLVGAQSGGKPPLQ